jgi:hypothetical protein
MNGRQRLRIGRAALVAALAVAPGADAAPPPNDDLANATVISTLPFTDTVDNSEATSEAGEPSCFGPPPQAASGGRTPRRPTDSSGRGRPAAAPPGHSSSSIGRSARDSPDSLGWSAR